MQGLAPIDGWALLAILAKATGYVSVLLAIGGPLFLSIFRTAPEQVRAVAYRLTVAACCLGLVVLALRLGIRAGRLGGMGLRSAFDTTLLRVVWDSPLGTVITLRGLGYAVVLLTMFVRPMRILALIGAALIALSTTQIGHVSAMAGIYPNLLILHVVMAGFWIAALVPLHQAVAVEGGAAVLRAFGWIAVGVVGLLVLAGLILCLNLIGGFGSAIGTAYGSFLALKIFTVAGLLGLAARNKLVFVPGVETGAPNAEYELQRAIRLEIGLVLLVLVLTATITTVSTPPIKL